MYYTFDTINDIILPTRDVGDIYVSLFYFNLIYFLVPNYNEYLTVVG